MTCNVNVRLARPEEDLLVGDLLVDAFLSAFARKLPDVVYNDDRKRHLRAVAEKRSAGVVLVAELETDIIGTVTVLPPRSPMSEAWLPNAADLRHLAIASSHHGAGLSRCLLDAAEDLAKSWNASTMCLHVRRGAVGVARLYEKRGYQRDASGDCDLTPFVYLEAYALPLL
ncbi:MAG: GNAT family N-acetyltransferase [Myxococcales bacterium]